MSRPSFKPYKTALALTAALLAAAVAAAMAEKPKKPPREAVGVTRSTYKVIQAGEQKGSEKIVHTVYNDNTVVFEVESTLHSTPEVTMQNSIVFTAVDESFFPLEYHAEKTITHPEGQVTIGIDAEMFANVAVYTTRSGAAEGNSREIVLPAGSVFLETGVVYSYYQLLFAYHRELGGRQTFNTLNVDSGKPGEVVVQLLASDTINVEGTAYEVDIYKIQRKSFDITLYVDHDDRIVRVEQNMMAYDLAEWSGGPPAD
jgi:hypothetical protein